MTIGSYGAGCLVSMVLADYLRRVMPEVGLIVSLLPLVVASAGVVALFRQRRRPRLPRACVLALYALSLTCLWGAVVAIGQNLPIGQIVAGLIAEAGPAPGLILGFAVGTRQRDWSKLERVIPKLLIFSVFIAVLQQAGFGVLTMIEGAQTDRQMSQGRSFQYSSGPFRTANVFAQFLVLSALVVVLGYAEKIRGARTRFSWGMYGALLLLVGGSVLAARRTGIVVLFGVLLPFLISVGGKMKIVAVTMLLAFVIFVVSGGSDSESESGLAYKVSFATSEVQVGGRIEEAFSVRGVDWPLLSFVGDGLGSHGPATQAAGARAFENEHYLIEQHPIMHVGWFVDLQSYGPLAAATHLIWFLLLLAATIKERRLVSLSNLSSRWSGPGFVTLAIVNYYLVSTSWLHSVTGGLLFGLGIGLFLGRMRVLSEPKPGSRVPGEKALGQR